MRPALSAVVRQNALSAIAQVVFTSLVLFVFYRIALRTVGADALGVWSVVMATTSVAQLANLGLGAAATRFVAKYRAFGDGEAVNDIVLASAALTCVSVLLVLVVALPLSKHILAIVLPSARLAEGSALIPFAIMSLCCGILAGLFHGVLDGLQRVGLRSLSVLAGNSVLLASTVVLAPARGLIGLAMAQLIQSATVMLLAAGAAFVVLRPTLGPGLYGRVKQRIGEIIRYSVQFQAAAACQLLYDPVTKGFLAQFGGLSAVAYFEMASRLILQSRQIIVAGAQVLVPAFAAAPNASTLNEMYAKSSRFLTLTSVAGFGALASAAVLISSVWLGEINHTFLAYLWILVVTWLANTTTVSAYLVNVGSGELRANTISHLGIAIGNVVLSLALGVIGVGRFIVLGWSAAVIAGSLWLSWELHRRRRILLSAVFSRDVVRVCLGLWMLAASGSLCTLLFPSTTTYIVAPSTFVLTAAFVLWKSGLVGIISARAGARRQAPLGEVV